MHRSILAVALTTALCAAWGCSLLLPPPGARTDGDADTDAADAAVDAARPDADRVDGDGDVDGAPCENLLVPCTSGTGCPSGTECCGDRCTNTRLDPQHCGGCDQTCSAGARYCIDGECTDDLGGTTCSRDGPCAAGQTCCRDACCPQGQVCCRYATAPGRYTVEGCFVACPAGCPEG